MRTQVFRFSLATSWEPRQFRFLRGPFSLWLRRHTWGPAFPCRRKPWVTAETRGHSVTPGGAFFVHSWHGCFLMM